MKNSTTRSSGPARRRGGCRTDPRRDRCRASAARIVQVGVRRQARVGVEEQQHVAARDACARVHLQGAPARSSRAPCRRTGGPPRALPSWLPPSTTMTSAPRVLQRLQAARGCRPESPLRSARGRRRNSREVAHASVAGCLSGASLSNVVQRPVVVEEGDLRLAVANCLLCSGASAIAAA